MKKSIFRPIQEGEDVTDILVELLIGIAIGGTVIIMLIAGWTMFQSSDCVSNQVQYERNTKTRGHVPLGNTVQKAL